VKRIAFGRRVDGRWVTDEIVTCRTSRGRERLCSSCGRPIEKGAVCYSVRTYYRSYTYALLWRDARGGHRTLCRSCWRGEEMSPRGDLVKFVDRSRPRGRRVVGVRPFSSERRSSRKEGSAGKPQEVASANACGNPPGPPLCGVGVGSPSTPGGRGRPLGRSGA
jgi:hypothetical protein